MKRISSALRMNSSPLRRVSLIMPSASWQSSSQREQHVDELIDRADHPRVALVVRRGDDQVDQVLADVGVRLFESAGPQRAGAEGPGKGKLRQSRGDPLRKVVVADLEQSLRVGEPRHDDLPERADNPVVEGTVDDSLFVDDVAREGAGAGSVLV